MVCTMHCTNKSTLHLNYTAHHATNATLTTLLHWTLDIFSLWWGGSWSLIDGDTATRCMELVGLIAHDPSHHGPRQGRRQPPNMSSASSVFTLVVLDHSQWPVVVLACACKCMWLTYPQSNHHGPGKGIDGRC